MTKTTINAEHDYVDERLGCGVNDMTFEEWLSYQNQMLRYYNTYQYDSGPYEEECYRSEDESSDEDVFICAIQPILEQAIAVVTPEARIVMVNGSQTETTGGSRHDHRTFIVT